MKTKFLFALCLGYFAVLVGDNQTSTLSPILLDQPLPFQVKIELADFALPSGVQGGAFAIYHGKWLLIAGRTNGVHAFDPGNNNFPPSEQNTVVYVIDPKKKKVYSRSLYDPKSGLSQHQIDLLSVVAPQWDQVGSKLYFVGGYGVDTSTGQFSTKDALTAIDIPDLMHWVTHPDSHEKASKTIRTIKNSVFQMTGGELVKSKLGIHLLMLGQNFAGFYNGDSDGIYSQQVRRFKLHDDGKKLSVKVYDPSPLLPDPNFRRRDLNIVPIVKYKKGIRSSSFLALAGVFTETEGVWTVPVEINQQGHCFMADPASPTTFKQAMNHYVSATVGLFSKKHNDMYTLLFGGISYGFIVNGSYQVNGEIPFTSQVTAIKIDREGLYTQYLLDSQYPNIYSTQSNPGNLLLFGANAFFIPVNKLESYSNGVFQLDKLKKPTLLGYIVGGIQSTLPNTVVITDSSASPYIFKVIAYPIF